MKTVQRIVRWVLTILLLYVVWHHSHWSVALTLTGLSIAQEFQAYLSGLHARITAEIAGPPRTEQAIARVANKAVGL